VKEILIYFFSFYKMNDNVFLTLLGAVGIGALVMGMNQEEVKENFWYSIQLQSKKGRVKVTKDKYGNVINEEEIPEDIHGGMQQLQQVANQQMMQSLQANQSVELGTRENFQHPSNSLGSGQVTGNQYVSYPDYQQSITQPSPSLGLSTSIRYNPASTNMMGITDAFHCNQTPVVEGWQSQDPANPAPVAGYSAGNYNKLSGQVREDANSMNANMEMLGDKVGQLGENVMIFDRYMTVPGKSAGRFNRGNGIVDRIRGDLPVCVDPCQKGWFASPGNPSQLTVGALAMIGGQGEQANAIANFTTLYGAPSTAMQHSGRGNAQMTMLSMAAPTGGSVQTTAFH